MRFSDDSRGGSIAASIASGQTISGSISLQGTVIMGIIMPVALTGTTLYLNVSTDGITFYNIVNTAGSPYGITATGSVGNYVALDPNIVGGANYVQLQSQAAEAATRSFQLVVRALS